MGKPPRSRYVLPLALLHMRRQLISFVWLQADMSKADPAGKWAPDWVEMKVETYWVTSCDQLPGPMRFEKVRVTTADQPAVPLGLFTQDWLTTNKTTTQLPPFCAGTTAAQNGSDAVSISFSGDAQGAGET